MKAYKLYVMNEEQSRQAHEKAFELGYKWAWIDNPKRKYPMFCNEKFLLFFENGEISYPGHTGVYCGAKYEAFIESTLEEISFHDFMQLKPKAKPFKTTAKVIDWDLGKRDKIYLTVIYNGRKVLPIGTKVKVKEILWA